jgi:23S rRNA (uracil1939-C5)-methyltransferase
MPPETVVVVPEGWLSRGEAYVRGEGEQLSIFGGIPGEEASVRIYSRQFQQVRGRMLAPTSGANPARVLPSCEKWGPCGGCPWMHLRPGGQRDAHDELWAAAFSDVGVPTFNLPAFPATLRGAEIVSDVEVEWGESDHGQPRLGVAAREGQGLVAIPKCEKASPLLQQFMGAAYGSLVASKVPTQRPPIRKIRARQVGDELFVTAHTANFAPKLADWALSLAKHLPAVSGVVAKFPAEHDPKGTGLQRLYGHDGIDTTIADCAFRLGADDTLPRDLVGYAHLLSAAPQLLGVAQGEAVLDIGAGFGLRAVVLARASGWALAIEGDENLARRTAETILANRAPVELLAEAWLYALDVATLRLRGRRPLVWIDAGRKELGQRVVDAVHAVDPRRVALQCSNPTALAREVLRWTNLGYRLESLHRFAVDPHTPFVEAVAVFASSNQAAPALRAPRRRTVR